MELTLSQARKFFFPAALTSSPVFTRNRLACVIFYASVDKIRRKRDFFFSRFRGWWKSLTFLDFITAMILKSKKRLP